MVRLIQFRGWESHSVHAWRRAQQAGARCQLPDRQDDEPVHGACGLQWATTHAHTHACARTRTHAPLAYPRAHTKQTRSIHANTHARTHARTQTRSIHTRTMLPGLRHRPPCEAIACVHCHTSVRALCSDGFGCLTVPWPPRRPRRESPWPPWPSAFVPRPATSAWARARARAAWRRPARATGARSAKPPARSRLIAARAWEKKMSTRRPPPGLVTAAAAAATLSPSHSIVLLRSLSCTRPSAHTAARHAHTEAHRPRFGIGAPRYTCTATVQLQARRRVMFFADLIPRRKSQHPRLVL